MLNSIKLITGNSHPELGELVSRRLGVPLTECVCRKFADQSIDVRIGSSVRDQDVYVIQSGHSPYIDPIVPILTPNEEGQRPCPHHGQDDREHDHCCRC